MTGQEPTRSEDVVGRLGGDEFALLLPSTDLPGATGVGERLVTHVRTAGAPYGVTVSVGAAMVTWGGPVGRRPRRTPPCTAPSTAVGTGSACPRRRRTAPDRAGHLVGTLTLAHRPPGQRAVVSSPRPAAMCLAVSR